MAITDDQVKAFCDIADRIKEIMNSDKSSLVEKIRKLPITLELDVDGLDVCQKSSYGSPTREQKVLASRVFDEMKKSERARGKKLRAERLLELSAELESLRAVLPSMAAKLSIELGVKARDLAREAVAECD